MIFTTDGDATCCPYSLLSLLAAASIKMAVDDYHFGCGGQGARAHLVCITEPNTLKLDLDTFNVTYIL